MIYIRYIQGAPRYLEERHVGLDPGENGGLVEELPGWVGRSAHQAVRTLLLGVLNQAAHLQKKYTFSIRNCIKFKENHEKANIRDHRCKQTLGTTAVYYVKVQSSIN
jgi:hypothetical protein